MGNSITSPMGPDYLRFEMLLGDGPALQHRYNDPVRPIAFRNDFKIYLKGLLTTLMQCIFKCVYLLLPVYGPLCNWYYWQTTGILPNYSRWWQAFLFAILVNIKRRLAKKSRGNYITNDFIPFACTFLSVKSRYIRMQQRRIWLPSGAIIVLDVLHGDMYRPNSIFFRLLIWSLQDYNIQIY